MAFQSVNQDCNQPCKMLGPCGVNSCSRSPTASSASVDLKRIVPQNSRLRIKEIYFTSQKSISRWRIKPGQNESSSTLTQTACHCSRRCSTEGLGPYPTRALMRRFNQPRLKRLFVLQSKIGSRNPNRHFMPRIIVVDGNIVPASRVMLSEGVQPALLRTCLGVFYFDQDGLPDASCNFSLRAQKRSIGRSSGHRLVPGAGGTGS
jgi:hypothetical protein